MQIQLLIKFLESWVERVKINLVAPTFNKLRIKISEKQFSLINKIVKKNQNLLARLLTSHLYNRHRMETSFYIGWLTPDHRSYRVLA